jgi:hypothetical protein
MGGVWRRADDLVRISLKQRCQAFSPARVAQ